LIVCGLDLSMNHYALVMKHIESKKTRVIVAWNVASRVHEWHDKIPSNYRLRFVAKTPPEKEMFHYYVNGQSIIEDIRDFQKEKDFAGRVLVALEGYAYSSSPVGLARIVEMTALVKEVLYFNGHAIRLHDPLSVKMWAGDAHADKDYMVDACLKKYKIPDCLLQTKTNPGQDVADAYFLMKMMEAEYRVRMDPMRQKKYKDKQRQVFNRVTKAYPENLLCRPFLVSMQPEI